jgi:vanillate O-demethylase ferredoxin subunit
VITGFSVRIARRTAETKDIAGIELEQLDHRYLPKFTAGAHIELMAPNGMVRQYSLCGSPSVRQRYSLGILREYHSRGASESIHEHFVEGDVVKISTPKNHFPLLSAQRSLLFAGGVGITPLLSMAEQLTEDGADFELHYYARSRDRAAFITRLEASSYADRVVLHLDDEAGDRSGEFNKLLASSDANTQLYLCGPRGFIEQVYETAIENNWSKSQINFEHFNAKTQENVTKNSFKVQIASTGETFDVPDDESITTVLAGKGISIPVSCEEGVCGTCIIGVLNGEPEHRDEYFNEEERALNNQMMPCCSRSLSPELLLDL